MRTSPQADLDWNLVRSFVAVVEAGSLAGAARELQMAHPTIARHVQQLEAQLGLVLFDRTSHGLSITAQGQGLAMQAQAMQREAVAFERLTDSVRSQPLARMRITAAELMGDVLANMLPTTLEELAQEQQAQSRETIPPTVELILSNEQLNLLERQADIAIRHVQPEQQDLICRKLGSLPMTLCASSDYLERYGEVTMDNLAQHRFIDDAQQSNFEKGAAARGLTIPSSAFALRTNSVRTQLRLMCQGGGIAALPKPNLAGLANVVHLLESEIDVSLGVWLVARPELRNNDFAYDLFKALGNKLGIALNSAQGQPVGLS